MQDDERPPKTRNVTIAVGDVTAVAKRTIPVPAITDGVLLARDLVKNPQTICTLKSLRAELSL